MEVKIFKMIKTHWAAILIAVALGFLIVLSFLYFQISLDDQYRGALNQIIDDELFYMARIKDVVDGHQTLGNSYLLEHKNQLSQQLFLPEWLLAQPLKLLNLDIVEGRILYNFILPALAFLLTYTAFYRIYPFRFWASIFTAFLFFGLYLFKFTRPVVPQFVFIFWLTQFIFLWELIKNHSNKNIKLLNILNFGLLFYLYPFYWTFYLVFFAVLGFVYFFKEKPLSKSFLKILAGGLIIGSIYFYLTFLASRLPEYQETMTRLQLVFSRSPSEVKSVVLSLAVLALLGIFHWFKRITINKEVLFFIAGIISIFLITNQNIITGLKLEFGHYRMPAIFFLSFAVYYLGSRFNFFNLKFKHLIAFFVIIISSFGAYGYIQRISNISEQDIYRQKYGAIFVWLNENTPSDSVVYANEDISGLIPIYTANNVFYSRYANLFIISDREVEERFILNNFFEKIDRDFVIERERSIWGVRYVDRYGDAVQANKWRKLLGLKLKDETRLPENEIERILIKAGEIQKNPPDKSFKKYRVDYFIWDKNKNPNWNLEKFDLEPVYDSENIHIFK